MKLHQLTKKLKKTSKRVGRGTGSGRGRKSGRGAKGQKSRSGYNIPRRFEGGQTTLIQRAPKAGGFRSKSQKPTVINLDIIEKKYQENEIVSPDSLSRKNLVKSGTKYIKILGRGKLSKKLKFENCQMSKPVKKIIEASNIKPTN